MGSAERGGQSDWLELPTVIPGSGVAYWHVFQLFSELVCSKRSSAAVPMVLGGRAERGRREGLGDMPGCHNGFVRAKVTPSQAQSTCPLFYCSPKVTSAWCTEDDRPWFSPATAGPRD